MQVLNTSRCFAHKFDNNWCISQTITTWRKKLRKHFHVKPSKDQNMYSPNPKHNHDKSDLSPSHVWLGPRPSAWPPSSIIIYVIWIHQQVTLFNKMIDHVCVHALNLIYIRHGNLAKLGGAGLGCIHTRWQRGPIQEVHANTWLRFSSQQADIFKG